MTTITTIDATHDPARTSWVEGANGHPDFPIQNLPLGVAALDGGAPRIVTAIGDWVLDLKALAPLLPEALSDALQHSTLNALFDAGSAARRALRQRVSDLLSDPAHRGAVAPHLSPACDATMHMPAQIGDYTDFYVGIHHANNIGRQFRPDNPLLPNYKHIPIGYHGRASSIRLSCTPVVRPNGQTKPPTADAPCFGPCKRLDYELELGIWVGGSNPLGQPIPIGEAAEHIAGLCLLNDWSARDVQGWETQPLGPFLAKNFQTSISPWVVTAEALAPYRIAQQPRPEGDPQPLPYLWDTGDQAHGALGLTLEVHLLTSRMRAEGMAPERLSHGPATHMYWTIAQLVAHHTSNGCNLSSGDLLGSGTISAPTRDGFGSLMEISVGGTQPFALANGESRSFLEDGDELILSAYAQADGFVRIGLGECRGVVLPAPALAG